MLFLIYSSILLLSQKGKSEVKIESEKDGWNKPTNQTDTKQS